jgi:peptidoglycan/LPS O-acetylase OafA/YrhL
MGMNTSYRKDLDGLRAIAIISGCAFHTGFGFKGGFVGAEIFFAVSGFLITFLLLSEYTKKGKIGLVGFWSRRAKRLFPGLVVMILLSTVAMGFVLLPGEALSFKASAFWSLLYGANWHLLESGQTYVGAAFTESSPLRHMWSLAVEEQFYLVWPIILIVIFAFKKNIKLVLGILILISVIYTQYLVFNGGGNRIYYDTFARVYELLVGAYAAVLVWQGFKVKKYANGLSYLSIFVLGVLLVISNDGSSLFFPWGSLLAVLATSVIIVSLDEHENLLKKLLSSRAMRYVGVRAYGIFLYHMPVLVLVPRFSDYNRVINLVIAVMATFILAILSFKFVEDPIRKMEIKKITPKITLALGVSVLLVSSLMPGLYLAKNSTLSEIAIIDTCEEDSVVCTPSVLLNQVVTEWWCPEDLVDKNIFANGKPSRNMKGNATCSISSNAKTSLRVAVVGDSEAKSLVPGLLTQARKYDWELISSAKDGCPFIFGDSRPKDQLMLELCNDSTKKAISSLKINYKIDKVIVSNHFLTLNGCGDICLADLESNMGYNVDEISMDTQEVLLVLPIRPIATKYCILTTTEFCALMDEEVASFDKYLEIYKGIYARIAAKNPEKIKVISVENVSCPNTPECSYLQGRKPIRGDFSHISSYMSVEVAKELATILNK